MTTHKRKPMGYVHFDTPSMRNYISEFLITQEMSDRVFRNKYVKTECAKNTFVGRVLQGPFFIPEEIGRDSAFAQTAILKGDKFPIVPNYYALARIEWLGEMEEGKLKTTNTRPTPKAPVFELTSEEVQELIGIKGDMTTGRLIGYEDVLAKMDSQSKKILPRNIGIFGTVGAGKTNTAQVIIEDSSASGYAVIVVDIEGEYINMDKPSEELHEKRAQFGITAEGLKDFKVFYPIAGESKRERAIPFDIEFSSMDLTILAEILKFTEAQGRVFDELIDRLHEKVRERKKGKRKRKEKESEAIRFLTGVPEEGEEGEGFSLLDAFRTLYGELIPEQRGPEKSASYTLSKKLAVLNRAKIFDQPDVAELQIGSLLKPGRVSIIDVSGCDEEVKNIVIAWILRRVFNLKLKAPKKTPKTLILIEEAHTFVSREARERMAATLAMIRTIARRGRKRWLCLGFISQQPSHLPSEIFELCNTRIIHGIKSERNLEALKATGGDIAEEVWDQVPSLGVGQAIISSPQFNHPIQVDIRPAKSKREFIE